MWSDRTPPERLRNLVEQLKAAQLGELRHSFAVFKDATFTGPLATVSYTDGVATVSAANGTLAIEGRAFEILEAMLEAWRDRSDAKLVGFLSYDLATELEDLEPQPPADFDFPKFHFGLYDSGAAEFDAPECAPLVTRVLSSLPDRAAFEASVARIVKEIHAGDIFQTNLCRRIETDMGPGAAWSLFEQMRAISPSEYEAFLQIDESRSVLSISPELFLKVSSGVVESSPIKGTRPRSGDPAELLASEKDRAELAMIVDVVRNDLARVCRPGSVQVVEHASLMTLPTVYHLFSTARGCLRKECGAVDLLRAAFPAASISGAPKIEAMRMAAREEGQLRGPCMGAIGWISMDGDMELSVAIRTAFVTGGKVRYYAGCGITADSDPAAEFIESEHKAAAFVRALNPITAS